MHDTPYFPKRLRGLGGMGYVLGLIYKKGVGVCFSAYLGAKGLRIAYITQDRQRS